MQDILEICCGLDVHKETVVACLLKGSIDTKPQSTIKTFSTLISGLEELKSWIESENCNHVAMESTGIYWQPIYNVLENAFDGEITLIVANARHMKNVPGKKTDMKDAEWIASLLRAGLLRGSFIPPQTIRELRNLTRYRKSISEEIVAQKNRIEKHLQSCGFKLSNFLSDIFGVSGRAIIDHLATYGSISAQEVDSCEHLNSIEERIHNEVQAFKEQVKQLDGIPGIDMVAAASIIAEIGVDMSAFKTSKHICSWAGLSPGSNESAGKKVYTHNSWQYLH